MTARGWEVALQGHVGPLSIELEFATTDGPTLIVGPNGAGKTTLLRALAGAPTTLTGRVCLQGRLLMDSAEKIGVAPEDRRIGYVPQSLGLFPHLSVLHNVAFGCRSGGGDPHGRARAALERWEAAHLAFRPVHALSGGERQRVALARAMVIEPLGLLLDEPLAALDAGQRRKARMLVADHLKRSECPALIVTHDPRDLIAIDGPIVVIEGGRIVQQGRIQALARAPATEFVAELLALTSPANA